ncbi:MAG: rhodanese-like domain-containing protein [Bacteroidales bacterium]|nr:rhodanese-like domain-containing protein [Bacteroidales bacterium]
MSKFRILLVTALVSALVISSCTKDPDPINEAQVLIEYLESDDSPLGKDYVSTDLPSVMAATELQTLNATSQVYIIDIRSAADFAAGHIANAVNVVPADILTHLEGVANLSTYTKVAVVCYTGQTAGWVTSLLRIMGYDKAYSLKWGMCSWNSAFASRWNNAVAAGNSQAAQFNATATDKAVAGALPELNTGKTTGQEILEARVAAVLAEGFGAASVTNATVFGALSNYYIVNYWPLAQYNISHIPGAVQYTPKESLKLAVDLKTLPTDKPVAVYCYTGQTSAFLSAYLRLIGYDAKSILYGTNGMIYDIMGANSIAPRFSATEIQEYTYVTSTK